MSMVTVTAKRPGRVYERKFDHDACRELHARGWTVRELAERFGVTKNAIRRVVNERYRQRDLASSTVWQQGGVCPDCSAQTTRHRADQSDSHRCKACASTLAATSVKSDALLCMTCRTWKPDDAFPLNRSRSQSRRGRHGSCRSCLTVAKRDWREHNKLPCETPGCRTLVNAKNRGKSAGKPLLCRSCASRAARLRAAS